MKLVRRTDVHYTDFARQGQWVRLRISCKCTLSVQVPNSQLALATRTRTRFSSVANMLFSWLPLNSKAMTDSPQPSHPDDLPFNNWVLGFWRSEGISARTALGVAAGAACVLFAVAAQVFGFPILPGFDGSILAQPSPVVCLLVIAVVLVAATLIGTIIAGGVHFEAGLFSAAFGLIVLSLRCGNIQSVLFESGGSQIVYVRLMVELLILSGFLLALWFLLRRLVSAGRPAGSVNLVNNLTATIAQTVATAVFITVLCQTEAKNQCLASVGIASLLGSMLAYKYNPTRPSLWFWIGPLIAGFIGYALASLGQDSNLNIGIPSGTFAALARPLPLDYAGGGVAGAILGYWMTRKNAGAGE